MCVCFVVYRVRWGRGYGCIFYFIILFGGIFRSYGSMGVDVVVGGDSVSVGAVEMGRGGDMSKGWGKGVDRDATAQMPREDMEMDDVEGAARGNVRGTCAAS